MAYSQSTRLCSFDSALGPDALLLRQMSATEGVSSLFQIDLQCASEDADHDPQAIVGKPGHVTLETADGQKRFFHGIVARFQQGGRDARICHYTVTLRPWTWLLSRRINCRIFQDKTVPEIVSKVFEDAGFNDFEKKLQGSFPPRTFCVQYRESDFDFVSRLLEEEGIFFYFRHEEQRHVLVLTNHMADLPDCPGQATADYLPVEGGQTGRDTIQTWERTQQLQSGKYTLRDFNFEDPANSLETTAATTQSIGGNSKLEIYDFHIGDYGATNNGQRLARLRMEAEESAGTAIRGASSCRGFVPGHRFRLGQHFRSAMNDKQYMLTSVRHQLIQPSPLETTDGSTTTTYVNDFTCVPADTTFRPVCTTHKPIIQGPQTAMVVGPKGEEIYVDKYGRVKVQFHWDRLGKRDEASSCWIRVSRAWASKMWGQVAHPRIGDEVIVEFFDGDPDQPIITGCVYNAQTMPPYELPANKTQAGIVTRSSPDGTAQNFNEIRFEDKKGSEELLIHAEKDQTTSVENDQTVTVGHDQSVTIDHDQKVDIANEQSILVKKNRMLSVDENDTQTVGKDRTITVDGDHTETVSGSRTLSIGKDQTETVDGTLSVTVAKDCSATLQSNLTVQVSKDHKVAVDGQQVVSVAKEASLSAKKVQIKADDEITLVTGSASITMKKNGDITIKGNKITVKGDGDVVIKGSKIAQN
ncbi:MAG: type VI secretion system tip protein VgrG [Planctomycetes bacterium]|nr:type VI secretion system tip protein VgrG [Planctomycetota bacterium]